MPIEDELLAGPTHAPEPTVRKVTGPTAPPVPPHLRGFSLWLRATGGAISETRPGITMGERCLGHFDDLERAKKAMSRATARGEYAIVRGTRYTTDPERVVARKQAC
jgi:hypothetical protein